ncbi:MAG: DMT family transporter [Methylococcaceae bacterium]|jgi:drug/metabolite transporter (DMT)-like permease
MNKFSVMGLTALAMMAFAGNSLLCRLALKQADIFDAGGFSSLRLLSGTLTLLLIVWLRDGKLGLKQIVAGGNWVSAIALLAYVVGFSYAYISLPTSTGALILFSVVQITMIGYGWFAGVRLNQIQVMGILLSFAGFIYLLLPGIYSPSLTGTVLMTAAGIGWGIYSLQGKGVADPILVTAANFLRATTVATPLAIYTLTGMSSEVMSYAIFSGALASGLGYAIWYMVLPYLIEPLAASIQLSVPLLTALAGMVLLGEYLSEQFIAAAIAILGGIAIVTKAKN